MLCGTDQNSAICSVMESLCISARKCLGWLWENGFAESTYPLNEILNR